MQAGEGLGLEQMRAFLEASEGVGFKGRKREEVYGWVDQTLRQIRFEDLKRSGRGLVRRFICKMTGLSRAQSTRRRPPYQSDLLELDTQITLAGAYIYVMPGNIGKPAPHSRGLRRGWRLWDGMTRRWPARCSTIGAWS